MLLGAVVVVTRDIDAQGATISKRLWAYAAENQRIDRIAKGVGGVGEEEERIRLEGLLGKARERFGIEEAAKEAAKAAKAEAAAAKKAAAPAAGKKGGGFEMPNPFGKKK